MLISFASAGVGIKWEQESFLINEGEKTCLTYSVYNPWPESTYVQIELPEILKDVLTSQEAETKLIPSNTPSSAAIPVQFCFKAPEVYSKDCWIAGMICKQECSEPQKIYEGEVLVKSVAGKAEITGSGGSATTMAVSAPLRLKVRCEAHSRDFSLVYILLAIIALIIIAWILYNKYKKPESERKREKVEKLQQEIKKIKAKK